jgi:hypothetical protein
MEAEKNNRAMVLALTKYLHMNLQKQGFYQKEVPEVPEKEIVNPEKEALVDKTELKKEIITLLKGLIENWKGNPQLPVIAENFIKQLESDETENNKSQEIMNLFHVLKLDSTVISRDRRESIGQKRTFPQNNKKVWLRKTM